MTVQQPPLGRHHTVGGRQLLLHRSGTGGPAVVVLAGAGMMGLDYLRLHERIAQRTTGVLHDRAGTGWSEGAEVLPRTAGEVVAELRELLRTAGVPGPYLLVGHSLGGAYARHYARLHPADVAGLLLLDPFHEDLGRRVPQAARDHLDAMTARLDEQQSVEPTEARLAAARDQLTAHFAAWPEPVRGPLADRHLATYRAAGRENDNLYDKVADELRGAPPTPDVPTIVLSEMGHDATQAHLWPAGLLGEIDAVKRALHAELAAESPRGEHRVLDDAGHGWLHEERPDAVLAAVDDLLGAVSAAGSPASSARH
ncbi:alpha/beta fold hydrolase [Streptomyces sp. SID8379]|uniref:alpha/beta fold hydrolase n=1 Tax=unclassified Streptomyces TaxID=2593676 RepID=UPI00037532B2|nr:MULTISPECIES: alpha/beta hydrolase [unclassified Streptomyces]MYW67360.1 alpha/beta fold hydrolase [Streptomyces sp. SID8379]